MKLTLFSGVLLMLFFSSSAHAQITQKFLVVNNTGTALSAVYISPSGSNSWGYNILAKERMINNESFDFIKNIDKESCFYDVRFLDQNGKEYFIKSLDLCNISLITLSTVDNTKRAIKKE